MRIIPVGNTLIQLASLLAALGGPARPEPTFRGLRAAHVVVGTAIAEKEAL